MFFVIQALVILLLVIVLGSQLVIPVFTNFEYWWLFKRGSGLRRLSQAERKKLVMAADGALQQKLAAWVKVNELYASAIATYKGNWVPKIVMGNSMGTQSASGANELIQMLLAKTAMDLNLDIGIKK